MRDTHKCARMKVPRLSFFDTSPFCREAPKLTHATISGSGMVDLVSDMITLQYVGFENRGAVREYAFTLRGSGGTFTEYFVSIANAAFLAHRVRYQDGPDICSLRLHREFAARADHSLSTRFSVTDAELAEYMTAHAPKAKPGASTYKKDQEF